MTELMINMRLNDARDHILDDPADEEFPLHPNYSQSVEGRGPQLHSASYLDCAGRANLGRWRPI